MPRAIDLPTAHVHWLSFTLPTSTAAQAEELLAVVRRSDFMDVPTGLLGYEQQRVDGLGARVLSTERRQDVHVILEGKACAALSNEAMRKLLACVAMTGAKVTRLDLALDDAKRLVEPGEVWAAISAGELTGHTHVQRHLEGLRDGEAAGDTVYLGSARSRQQVRVYDKDREQRGRVLPAAPFIASASASSSQAPYPFGVRWEIECREETAETLAAQLRAAAPTEWGRVWAERLLAIADFREVAQLRAARRPRCAWFEQLVGLAQKVSAYVAQPARTLASVERWIERQVAPTLAAVFKARGGDLDYLLDALARGQQRWRLRHQLLMVGP